MDDGDNNNNNNKAPRISYNRETLLNIREKSIHHSRDLLTPDLTLFPELRRTDRRAGVRPKSGSQQRRRGRRAGVLVRLRRRAHRPPLPTMLLANVQSLDNKLCELRARICFQPDIRNCNVICLTETWLSAEVPDHAIEPPGFTVHRTDRDQELSGKTRGGGVCLMVNRTWCVQQNIRTIGTFCSPDLEYLMLQCRPFWLPREFTSVTIAGVYIPPQADTDRALRELHRAVNVQETAHPRTALIVAGDFNRANLKNISPKLYQHIDFNTRGDNTLDHCYTPFRNGYKALPRPPFGKSDHSSILLLPAYRQRLKREAPAYRTVHCWSDQSDAILQDCFDHVDWEMFRTANDSISGFTDTVTSFIRTCTEEVVPTKTIKTKTNQKPWINCDVRAALNARNTAFTSGSPDDYKHSRYSLRTVIKQAKRDYRQRVESKLTSNNPRHLWQGLQTMTDFKGPRQQITDTAPNLPDKLNHFYARFDSSVRPCVMSCPTTTPADNQNPPLQPLPSNTDNPLPSTPTSAENLDCPPPPHPSPMTVAEQDRPLSITEADVRRTLLRINPRKAAGPDGIPGRVLKSCAHQLAGVFTTIFNLSLSLRTVPTCFKSSTIIPIPKQQKVTSLNDWRPIALTPIISKCFEKLVKSLICPMLPPTLDPLQFAYRPNRGTEDAIAHVLHTALSHLEGRDTYVRMLFVDYSSAFNTIVPSRLVSKLKDLGLNTPLCDWILDFLTGRPQVVRINNLTSTSLTLSTGAPQGCVLSPLLYSLYTHDCVATRASNTIVKFADDTAVVGLISHGDEMAYREEVTTLEQWCQNNHLSLNISKTKEVIVDYRRGGCTHPPVTINGTAVERVDTFKYLGVNINKDLTWATHTTAVVRKTQQRLYALRRLKTFRLKPQILRDFYRGTIESLLTGCFTTWFGSCTNVDRKALERVVRSAQHITGCELPSLQELYTQRCLRKSLRVIKDATHPHNSLFSLLPSGRRYRTPRTHTSRLRNSFFPQAIRLLNL